MDRRAWRATIHRVTKSQIRLSYLTCIHARQTHCTLTEFIVSLNYLITIVVESLIHIWLFCSSVDCSFPGSCVHGVSQASILEWVAISFFRGSSQPRDWTCVSYIGRQILYHWAIREALIAITCYDRKACNGGLTHLELCTFSVLAPRFLSLSWEMILAFLWSKKHDITDRSLG